MAQFQVLEGKALKSAIAGFGKKVGTFNELTHQLAYSALAHLEAHHDAVYVQAVYDATPVNYRKSIVTWSTHFGKVSFDAKASTFTYSKAGKSDLAGALAVSPAEFVKSAKAGAKSEKSLMERMEKTLERVRDDTASSHEDVAFAMAMLNNLTAYKRSLTRKPAEPKATEPAVRLIKSEANKAAKAEAANTETVQPLAA